MSGDGNMAGNGKRSAATSRAAEATTALRAKAVSRKRSREKVRAYGKRMRAKGLRLVQTWLPGMRTPEFAAAAHRASVAAANNRTENEDLGFINSVAWSTSEQAESLAKREPKRCLRGPKQVKRGEIWSLSRGADHAGNPLTAVIVQNHRFDATASLAVCPLTGTLIGAALLRITITPSEANGLRTTAQLMVDKISTVPKSKLGRRLGRRDAAAVSRLNQIIALFLGLAE